MKKAVIVFMILLFGKSGFSQNLVQNGDFESFWHCPNNSQEIDSAKFWVQPTYGTPDYFNQCGTGFANVPHAAFGFQQAQRGVAFAGLDLWTQAYPNLREYIENTLSSPLVANECYYFTMYINLNNASNFTCYNIGVYFSDTVIFDNIPTNLPFTPQITNTSGNFPDTLNWTLVSGSYTAVGGERYLIIGNFNNDSNTTLTVNPSGNTGTSYVYIDDVCLTQCENSCDATIGIQTNSNSPQITIFPNPITTQLTINIDTNEPTEFTLYDITSRKIMQQTFVNAVSINTEDLAKGIYLYELRNKNGIIKDGKVVK